MPELRWTRDSTFHDGQRNFRARGPGVYDVPEEAVEDYLDHRSGAWERVEEDDEQDSSQETDADVSELEAEGESGTLPFNPEDHTNSGIKERVAEIDDVATLKALRNLEEEQKDRSGAKDAIDDRLAELEE
jgi:hypothetical protein